MMPPPTPRRKLLPPPPDKGEAGERDPLPEGVEGFPMDFEGLLPNPLLELPEPPKDLPPLLDLASASSESPSTTNTAKSEIRSVMCLMDGVLFDIRCLQYKKMVLNEKKESAIRRMAPQIRRISYQDMF
jgi:hypothetical protein